jgi:hypothetical protein
MTKINGAYVFFGLFVVVIIGLWVTGNLFKSSNKQEYTTTEIKNFLKTKQNGGKRKRKPRRKQRLR